MAEVVRRALLNELMTFLGSGRQELVTAILGARLRWHTVRRTGTFSSADPQPTVRW